MPIEHGTRGPTDHVGASIPDTSLNDRYRSITVDRRWWSGEVGSTVGLVALLLSSEVLWAGAFQGGELGAYQVLIRVPVGSSGLDEGFL